MAKPKEYVCFHCGQCMTEERAKDQMDRTGFDKPVCCGADMIIAPIIE